jgi:hypothetical protein
MVNSVKSWITRRPMCRAALRLLGVIGTALVSKGATSIYILVAKILGTFLAAKAAGECFDQTEGTKE